MPLAFDATLKDLAHATPQGFLTVFDRPPTLPVSVLNADLSTVTSAADVVYGLGEPLQEIVHLDFQAGPSGTKHADILAYNALLYRRYLVPVHSSIVLLRRQAAHANLDGTVRYAARPGQGKMDFGYEVVPLWKEPVEPLLTGEPELLPLAVLAQLPPGVPEADALVPVVHQMGERLRREKPENEARRLWTAAYVLTGLRVPRDVARQLFHGVLAMRESDTYLAILDEGREEGRNEGRKEGRKEGRNEGRNEGRGEEAKKMILLLGQERFGPPAEAVRAALNAISDLERLEQMTLRLLRVSSWEELLQQP